MERKKCLLCETVSKPTSIFTKESIEITIKELRKLAESWGDPEKSQGQRTSLNMKADRLANDEEVKICWW